MIRQCAVNKAIPSAASRFINDAHNSARIERPEAKMMCKHRNHRSGRDRGVAPTKLDPTDVEHLPSLDAVDGFLICHKPVSELDAMVVNGVAGELSDAGLLMAEGIVLLLG